MGELVVRAAEPAEAEALSALVMRSKAVWGYDRVTLDGFREQLRIRAGDVIRRRAVVAERDGHVLGVATLDGEPPEGALGLLFVEPDQLRHGVGTLLYRHVLDVAGRLGFRRLAIGADPHAVPFYLARGADPGPVVDGLARMDAWPVAPVPSWSDAWDGGERINVTGNVAEFNGQFGRRVHGPDHYSCLAAFCAARPAAIQLPLPVDEWWIEHVGGVLGWDDVQVGTGNGFRVRPWGLIGDPVVRRFESKRRANELFQALGGEHPGIHVPEQVPVRSVRQLRREIAGRDRAVLKSEYGVGGHGTVIVSGETPGLRRWAYDNVVLEEFIEAGTEPKDVTFDAVIADDGWVHPVGVGRMDVDGTAYRGVTVGPGTVPGEMGRIAAGFGTAVGRALAAEGYRGWFDVDYVATASGLLAPTEINVRLTGPSVAFHIQARLDRLRGGRHIVRTVDQIPLGARLPPAALRDHVTGIADRCRTLGVTLLVTVPTAAFDAAPYLGVALAARDAAAITEAEALVRKAGATLGDLFSPAAGR